jgi:PPM family protein phosphatase
MNEDPAFGATDVGRARNNNEDAFLMLPERHIYIVSDGMGGHNAGEVASSQAVTAVEKYLDGKDLSMMTQDEIRDHMLGAIAAAHNTVLDMSRTNPEYSKMGCTLVVSYLHNSILHISHVGDSRVYVISGEEINQATTDHSVVGELVQMGKMTKEEARKSSMKNQLTQAVGLPYYHDPAYSKIELAKGIVVLLCTDGLWDMLSDEEIHSVVTEKGTAEDIGKRLIQRANDAGGADNITVIVIKTEAFNESNT